VVIFSEDEHAALHGESMLLHYGTPRHSGRYPWGSGKDDETSKRNRTLIDQANELRANGLSETDVARALGMNTSDLRNLRTIARNEKKQEEIAMARKLKEKQLSNVAIAKQMTQALGYSIGDTQVANLLKDSQARKVRVLDNVTNTLRKRVDEKEYIDVGSGIEYQLNTTPTVLSAAIKRLKGEGYNLYNDIQIDQLGTGKKTNMKVLTKPDKTWGDVVRNRDKISQINDYSEDGGLTTLNMVYPKSISSKRVGIRYEEDGGANADGVIYVRPGVKDVSLGGKRYAQVRIMVDGTHYLKGMAIEKDDLPDGVDLLFNTNKKNTGNKLDAMKPLKTVEKTGEIDKDNPFGATISRQIGKRDPLTQKLIGEPTSVMNIVNDEGRWDQWSKTLSSQMLSKQKPALAKEQLDRTYKDRKDELDTILELTNPAVKAKLLGAYADGTDAAAVHLKAASLPRQKTQVLLPVQSMKTDEVYAPNFDHGESVVLIRFPHGGTFEIPELKVNNKNPEAKKLLGDAKDAIGIHPKVAERLSGADFDGDSVLVIPNNQGKVRTSAPLEGLKGFDPKSAYPPYEGMKPMTDHEKGVQMGLVSNLITDMTLGGASREELTRAVKHSMVVIDAEKHKLDWRRSERDNAISSLMATYQKSSQGGATTLISKARSPKTINERKLRTPGKGGHIDPMTGRLIYEDTGRTKTYVDNKGKQHTVPVTMQVAKLADTHDAHTLVSDKGTVIEKFYADHSNRLKDLANQARKESLGLKARRYNPSAREAFKADVETLDAKLNAALRNAPLERQAQVIANSTLRMKIQANPSLNTKEGKAERKRVAAQALAAARARTGAEKKKFIITQSEWDAIQAGAVTANKLDKILTYADLDVIKKLATPKATVKLSSGDLSRAKAMHASGKTWAEIARVLGVSVSTIQKEVKPAEEGD
jgi:hypothetical protein